jgi:hypothetical protein
MRSRPSSDARIRLTPSTLVEESAQFVEKALFLFHRRVWAGRRVRRRLRRHGYHPITRRWSGWNA